MIATKPVTLVLSSDSERAATWKRLSQERCVIRVSNYALLCGALQSGIHELGREVDRVVFDQSIDSATFLDFLSSLPDGFRGDILFIESAGRGFLSAMGRIDERAFYKLGAEDIEFYLAVIFAQAASDLPVVVRRQPQQRSVFMMSS